MKLKLHTLYRSSSCANSLILSLSSRVGTSLIELVCNLIIWSSSENMVSGIIYKHSNKVPNTKSCYVYHYVYGNYLSKMGQLQSSWCQVKNPQIIIDIELYSIMLLKERESITLNWSQALFTQTHVINKVYIGKHIGKHQIIGCCIRKQNPIQPPHLIWDLRLQTCSTLRTYDTSSPE